MRAIGVLRGEIEPDFATGCAVQRFCLLLITAECNTARRCFNFYALGAGGALIDYHTGREAITFTHETRERRTRQEGTRHQHRRLARSVAITGCHGNGHHTECRDVVRQFGAYGCCPARIRNCGANKKRGGLETRAQNTRYVAATAATCVAFAFLSFRHLCSDSREVAGQTNAERPFGIQQLDRIGRLITRQRKHTFVHGP
jgi:hypothetical protein